MTEEKKSVKHVLCEEALVIAAEDMYKAEIVDTEMEDALIGIGRDYSSEEEWIEERIAIWLELAAQRLGV